MDHAIHAVISEGRRDRIIIDVDDVFRVLVRFFLAGVAQTLGKLASLLQRPLQHVGLPGRIMENGAHFLIFHVIGTERVAMEYQGGNALEIDYGSVPKQGGADLVGEYRTQRQIPVSTHQV